MLRPLSAEILGNQPVDIGREGFILVFMLQDGLMEFIGHPDGLSNHGLGHVSPF